MAAVAAVAASGGVGGALTLQLAPATAATGGCSKTTAARVATRLHVGVDPLLGRTPIFQVLCGPFLGPGSQGMVASVAVPTRCGGSLGWAVFRFEAATWQLVMERLNGAFLSAAGSDIRERVGAPRPGDPLCSPSAWKTRTWHWSGSRFVAGPWHVTRAKVDRPTRFRSPSGNIECWMYDGAGNYGRGVGCTSDIPPKSVILSADGRLKIRGHPFACGCDEPDPPRLAYGKQITVGRFRCVSQETGVTCTVIKSGKGFLINRDGVSRIGS